MELELWSLWGGIWDLYFPLTPWLEILGYEQVGWKELWIGDQDFAFCSQHLGQALCHFAIWASATWSGPWELEYITLHVSSGSSCLGSPPFVGGIHVELKLRPLESKSYRTSN